MNDFSTHGRAAEQKFSESLAGKPGGCVVWMEFDENVEFTCFRFLDVSNLDVESLRIARHTKANAQGVKAERPGHRVAPKRLFTRVIGSENVAIRLFPGTFDSASAFARRDLSLNPLANSIEHDIEVVETLQVQPVGVRQLEEP